MYHGQKVSFAIAVKDLGQNVSFRNAGMCRGQKGSSSMAGMSHKSHKYKSLECVVVEKVVSAWAELGYGQNVGRRTVIGSHEK
jgi:hypothetical protein